MNSVPLSFLFVFLFSSLFSLEYEATLTEDCSSTRLHKALIEGSELLSHRKTDIQTIFFLQKSIDQDKEDMLTRAKNFGYLDATIHSSIEERQKKWHVLFTAALGTRYRLDSIGFHSQGAQEPPSLKDIPSFVPGMFFTSEELLALEHELLYSLLCRGYPRATIVDTIFEADKETKQLSLFFKIDLGPYTTFGPITINGLNTIDADYLLSKIPIKTGAPYKKNELDETENRLLQTGLLSSASFDTSLPVQADGTLPITLHVQEAKLHSIGAGVNYMTTIGPGVAFLYEDRYFNTTGQKLGSRFDLWQKKKQANITLTTPSFVQKKQNRIWLLEYESQIYLPYHSSSLSASYLVEQQLSHNTETVYGARVEHLRSTHILSEKEYELCKLPLQLKWNNSNSLFDPTKGASLNVRLTPSTQFVKPHFSYLIQQTTLCSYSSFIEDKYTLALKGVFGDIVGANKKKIPIPDRFFGGSDTVLRGYKTGTVSPTDKKGTFIGGDSLLAGSIEMRIRQKKEALGWVLFYDLGKVYAKRYPDSVFHLFHSLGMGVRYTTPIGPLRLDIAFPLNRRRGIDPILQLYFSIGQAF